MPDFYPVIEKRGSLIILGAKGEMLAKPGKCVVVDDKIWEGRVIDVLYGNDLYRVRCKLVRSDKHPKKIGQPPVYYDRALQIIRKL